MDRLAPVGAYRLGEPLGQGRFGTVFRATEMTSGQPFALKMLSPKASADPMSVARFRQELDTLSRLSHPNIIRIRDSGVLDGQLFYAMDLVEGRDLERRIRERGPVALPDVLAWMIQAADALAYLHQLGVCHRDVRPANLLLDEQHRILLIDFGLIKAPDLRGPTRPGTLMGAMRFLAPEAILRDTASPARDVWALALTTHELLAGRTCYAPASLHVLQKRILDEPPPSLETVRSDVPRWLLELQGRALAKDPGQRIDAAGYRDGLRDARL